jgi:F420-dependent oxidoreductase-like protein
MKLGMFEAPTDDVAASLERAVALEEAGIDVIGVPEGYGFDGVSMLGALAASTSRAQLMSQILPIYSRTPTLTAMTAAGLDAVSGGRFALGLGASAPAVVEGWHGVPYDAPLGRTREVVEICRAVWRREPVEYRGRYYQLPLPAERGTGLGRPLKLIGRPVHERIPIFLAALGAKNVELTAEIADGWLPFLYFPERAGSVWVEPLARGRARRAASLGPLQVCAGGPMAVGAGLEHLRDLDRPRVALYVGGMGARGKNFFNDLARSYGYEAEADRLQELYLDGKKQAAAAAVPAGLLEGTSLIGDEAYLRDRLCAYAESGVTSLQIDPIGADPIADVRRLRELVEDL